MIKYQLQCKECKLIFDSWFAASKEYEKLKKKKLLTCHSCNSQRIEKSLMAPMLINTKNEKKNDKELKLIKKKIRNYQNFIKKNFEYVGKNFAYEARAVHYDNSKKKRVIYGTASKKDLKELREEGIKTQMMIWVDDKSN